MKFTYKGTVKIVVQRKEDQVIEILVSDTGSVMSEENLGKIFQDVKIDANKATSTGLGLGLLISNKLANQLGFSGI